MTTVSLSSSKVCTFLCVEVLIYRQNQLLIDCAVIKVHVSCLAVIEIHSLYQILVSTCITCMDFMCILFCLILQQFDAHYYIHSKSFVFIYVQEW